LKLQKKKKKNTGKKKGVPEGLPTKTRTTKGFKRRENGYDTPPKGAFERNHGQSTTGREEKALQ